TELDKGSFPRNGPRPGSTGQVSLYKLGALSSNVVLMFTSPPQLRSNSLVRVPAADQRKTLRSPTPLCCTVTDAVTLVTAMLLGTMSEIALTVFQSSG